MSESPLQKGDAVEIHAIWAFGADRVWMKGYSFSHAEESGDCIVTHTDGPFAGAPVRMPAERVRRAQS